MVEQLLDEWPGAVRGTELRNAVVEVFLRNSEDGLTLERVMAELAEHREPLELGASQAEVYGALGGLRREDFVRTMRDEYGQQVWYWVPPLVSQASRRLRRRVWAAVAVAVVLAVLVAGVVWGMQPGRAVSLAASGSGTVAGGASTTAVPVVTTTVTTSAAVSTTVAPPASSVSATGVPAVPPVRATSVPRPCQEDEPCWNSCTMGVDGRFPVTDPRYRVPGPCDLWAVLPYGKRFELVLQPGRLPEGQACDDLPPGQAWRFMRATVLVVSPEGRVLASRSGEACVPPGDPLAGGMSDVLPELFREAGKLA